MPGRRRSLIIGVAAFACSACMAGRGTASGAPDRTAAWTLQSTVSLTTCLSASAARRVPRTPQGVGLANYLHYLIELAQSLPGSDRYPALTATLTTLRVVQARLNAGYTYVSQRDVLEDHLDELIDWLSAYIGDVAAGDLEDVPFTPALSGVSSRAFVLARDLYQEVATTQTDAELSTLVYRCAVAPA